MRARELLLAHAKAPHVLERQVDAAAGKVLAHVLKVLGQLERAADAVREGDTRGGGDVEHVQHQLSHRVGGKLAVAEQVLEALVAARALVAAVGLDQAQEGIAREPADGDAARETHHQRVRGPAGKGAVELRLEPVERGQAVAGERVAQLVHEPREAVDGEQVLAHRGRQDAAGDGEVLGPGARHDGSGGRPGAGVGRRRGCVARDGHRSIVPARGGRRHVHAAEPSRRQRPSAITGKINL